MQPSSFNLYLEDFPAPGQVLVHNTFSGAYVVLDEDSYQLLRSVEGADGEAGNVDERLAKIAISEGWIDDDIGIITSDIDAEKSEYRTWFDNQRSGAQQWIQRINAGSCGI